MAKSKVNEMIADAFQNFAEYIEEQAKEQTFIDRSALKFVVNAAKDTAQAYRELNLPDE